MGSVRESIGCVVMASGMSTRYGSNKLLEKLGGREIILHTAERLREAGLTPVIVAREPILLPLLAENGLRCVLHDGPLKSDTMHVGLQSLDEDVAGYLFMPADQPLVRSSSIKRLMEYYFRHPDRPVRLGYGQTAGSPVIFPALWREDILAYQGDKGGMEILKSRRASCDIVQAEAEWELLDVDTPEEMKQVREIYAQHLRQ